MESHFYPKKYGNYYYSLASAEALSSQTGATTTGLMGTGT
jgi:hypothetical protein